VRVDRAAYGEALEPARLAAYPPGEYVGQESFVTAGEVRALVARAGVGPDATVLDLCCGVGGPGRLVAAVTGCRYLGVDEDPAAVRTARAAADGLPCRFETATVPPLPAGRFDVVMLLETLLAFPDKRPLLAAVAASVRPGGRFVLTVEEGAPLDAAERAAMPASETVWPVRLPALRAGLERVGLRVETVDDLTASHRRTAAALADAFEAHRTTIAARLGCGVVDDLLSAHRLWVDWLGSGRMHKYGVVAVR